MGLQKELWGLLVHEIFIGRIPFLLPNQQCQKSRKCRMIIIGSDRRSECKLGKKQIVSDRYDLSE